MATCTQATSKKKAGRCSSGVGFTAEAGEGASTVWLAMPFQNATTLVWLVVTVTLEGGAARCGVLQAARRASVSTAGMVSLRLVLRGAW